MNINEIKDEYVLYIAGQPKNIEKMNAEPFGFTGKVIDPLNPKNAKFFELLNQLDGISYKDKGLAMPKWVSLDCGMLPSAFIGLAKPKAALDEKVLSKFELPEGYDGLVPVSEFCAIPSVSGEWVAHTLACVDNGKNLGFATKILGLKVYGATSMEGICQYDNPAIKIHTMIADLYLKSAMTPAHSEPDKTFVYTCTIDQESLASKLEEIPKGPSPLKDLSQECINEMQENISSGAKAYKIISPGIIVEA